MLGFGSRAAIAAVVVCASGLAAAQGDVVFNCFNDNGFFTPFNAGNANSGIRYGDSGWLSDFQAETFQLTSISFEMCVFASTLVGSTDIELVLTDGDPSGMVFGSAAELYRTTVSSIALPATGPGTMVPVTVTIPLPAIETLGGFNNIGWSIECHNFVSNGSFGFLCSTTNAQINGFYSANASFYNGSSWNLFSFGPNPISGVANFVTRIEIPAPTSAAMLGLAGLVMLRRRR